MYKNIDHELYAKNSLTNYKHTSFYHSLQAVKAAYFSNHYQNNDCFMDFEV